MQYKISLIIDSFSQLKVSKQRLYTVSGAEETLLFWEDYGVRITVPKGAVPSSVASCDIAVVPIVEGNFLFPDGTVPVSAVYAIGVSCKLAQPIRIELQHCDNPSDCVFAKAEHVETSPPYVFNKLSGGIFTPGSEYGVVETSDFTLFAILRERLARMLSHLRNPVTRYKLLMFYENHANFWAIHFIVTKNINSHIQVSHSMMKAMILSTFFFLGCYC